MPLKHQVTKIHHKQKSNILSFGAIWSFCDLVAKKTHPIAGERLLMRAGFWKMVNRVWIIKLPRERIRAVAGIRAGFGKMVNRVWIIKLPRERIRAVAW